MILVQLSSYAEGASKILSARKRASINVIPHVVTGWYEVLPRTEVLKSDDDIVALLKRCDDVTNILVTSRETKGTRNGKA